MNRVQLIGDLVWPVETRRDRATGQWIGRAMIAVSSDLDGLNFVPLTLHGREATDAAKYLGEGSTVYVNAHLHSLLVTDRDARGNKYRRRFVRVIADRVTYLKILPPRGGDRPGRAEDGR